KADNSTLAARKVFSATYTPPPKMISVPFAASGKTLARPFQTIKKPHRSRIGAVFLCRVSDTHCRVYLRQGLEADGLVHELAVLEVEQGRDAHDAVAGGQLRLGVHVDLADGDLAVVSLGELVEYR